MSDDFGTVSVRRGDRARELEVMRQRYRAHREALQRMVEDAPTDHLATEYQRLIGDLDASLAKLDELEGRNSTAAPPASPQPPPPRSTLSAGDRPLAGLPSDLHDQPTVIGTGAPPNPASRVAIIIIGGVIVLAAIVFLIWRGSERKGTTAVVEAPSATQTADTAASSTTPEVIPAATQTTAPAASTLKLTPLIADYGVIRKGTRAVRQFEAFNNGTAPITIQVARSSCRCLFYDYHDKVAPQKKETITVTVDGAKAKAGTLTERIDVTSVKDSSMTASFQISATIK